ncbi:MAG: DinB family protein [Bacteroidota bacterium]
MSNSEKSFQRREFLKKSVTVSTAMTGILAFPQALFSRTFAADPGPTVLGPREGYTPQIGTLVSMMAFCRSAVTRLAQGMTVTQLDWLLDDKANSIGALLYHLAACDALYYEHTFKGTPFDKPDPEVEKTFGIAMDLGEPARKTIKGNTAEFYLKLLQDTRDRTLAEFRKRDDNWLMSIDKNWYWGPTNNYCKWFHVCEHESHHQGQMALLKSRLPAK